MFRIIKTQWTIFKLKWAVARHDKALTWLTDPISIKLHKDLKRQLEWLIKQWKETL